MVCFTVLLYLIIMTTERPVGTERRNELGKGLLGASIGFAVLGPIGAAVGGFIGASIGCSEDNERKAHNNQEF